MPGALQRRSLGKRADRASGAGRKVAERATNVRRGCYFSPGERRSSMIASCVCRFASVRASSCFFTGSDAAAIAYLPDEIAHAPLFAAALAKARRNGADPYWAGLCKLPFGRIALVVAPIGGHDLFTDSGPVREVLERSIAYAGGLGARCVSLTGMIPAVTDLGLALTAPDGVTLTTGHAATASAMPTIPYQTARLALSWPESPPRERMKRTAATT